MTIGTWDPADPSDVDTYSFDWVNRLGAETISTSTWTISPSGTGHLAAGADSISGSKTSIILSAGIVNTPYTVTNRIVTSGSRTIERSAILMVKQR